MESRSTHRSRQHVAGTYLVLQREGVTGGGFFDTACIRFYHTRLVHRLRYYQSELHAYALLPDTIWLLITARSPRVVDRLLIGVNAAYGEYFNTRFCRATRPWAHYRRCSEITCPDFLPVCQKFIEQAPVRDGIVRHPGEWQWSSYCHNAFGGTAPWLTPHPDVARRFRLTQSDHSRYREFIADSLIDPRANFLRNRVERNLPLPFVTSPVTRGIQSNLVNHPVS